MSVENILRKSLPQVRVLRGRPKWICPPVGTTFSLGPPPLFTAANFTSLFLERTNRSRVAMFSTWLNGDLPCLGRISPVELHPSQPMFPASPTSTPMYPVPSSPDVIQESQFPPPS